jgi:hypothetical protein
MNLSHQLARHWRSVFTGGNWTSVNLRDTLQDVNLGEAREKLPSLNSIAALTYHLDYYTEGVLEVFRGKPLTIRDKFAWEVPELSEEADWQRLREALLTNGEALGQAIKSFAAARWSDDFTDTKYGSYISNVMGLTEHAHYHLGQMVVIKRIVAVR